MAFYNLNSVSGFSRPHHVAAEWVCLNKLSEPVECFMAASLDAEPCTDLMRGSGSPLKSQTVAYRSHRWHSNGCEGKLATPTLSGSGFLFHLGPRVL